MTEQLKSINKNENKKLNDETKMLFENKQIDETNKKEKKKKLFTGIFKRKTSKPKKTAESHSNTAENKENKVLYSYLCVKIDKFKGNKLVRDTLTFLFVFYFRINVISS